MQLRPDPQLIAAAADGDHEAFEELMGRWLPRAHSMARRMLGDADLAEDAVAEVAAVVWRSLPALRDATAFAGWLRAITLNVCRRLARRGLLAAAAVEPRGDGPDPGAGPAAEAETRARAAAIRRELACLPELYWRSLVLYYLGDVSVGEIAQELGLPAGTVKSRLSRGRALLAERLARAGWGPEELPSEGRE